jgi:hypothetical protein
MPALSLTDSFLHSLASLDAGDAKRVAAFLDKLVREPDAAGLGLEMVHDAADRTIRSMRVTQDLRAIVHLQGDRLTLLHVARHDKAYDWARTHCVECHPGTGELRVVTTPTPEVSPTAPPEPPGTVACTIEDPEALCAELDARGLPRDLRA